MDDLIGLGKAAEKLVDVVSRGCGVLYRPRAIRKEADAKAYEIRVLAKATAEVEAEQRRHEMLVDTNGKFAVTGDSGIVERARQRFTNREIERQKNIERIADLAFEELPSEAADAPVAKDWVRQFFNIAEDVSDEAVQGLWARVLAGEVARPGSFSIRTLNVLRNLTAEEAQAFEAACQLSFDHGYLLQAPPSRDWTIDWLSTFGLPYRRLLSLQEAGLIHDAESKSPFIKVETTTGGSLSLAVSYQGSICKFTTIKPQTDFEFVTIRFTSAGLELSRLVPTRMNEEFLRYVAKEYCATVEISGPDRGKRAE